MVVRNSTKKRSYAFNYLFLLFISRQKELDYDSVRTRIRKELIISSERFLSDEGCVNVFKYLHRYAAKKVVIIGGSHSAFACAELLLRGPKLYTTDEIEDYPWS